jgi:hypothetical protein
MHVIGRIEVHNRANRDRWRARCLGRCCRRYCCPS